MACLICLCTLSSEYIKCFLSERQRSCYQILPACQTALRLFMCSYQHWNLEHNNGIAITKGSCNTFTVQLNCKQNYSWHAVRSRRSQFMPILQYDGRVQETSATCWFATHIVYVYFVRLPYTMTARTKGQHQQQHLYKWVCVCVCGNQLLLLAGYSTQRHAFPCQPTNKLCCCRSYWLATTLWRQHHHHHYRHHQRQCQNHRQRHRRRRRHHRRCTHCLCSLLLWCSVY